jgi:FKBP-type peptidyl-prolyl cis-trans isomerase 2
MAQAKDGDTIKFHYSGKFEDGTEFDSSRNEDPLEITLGGGQLIPGLEEGLFGMVVGDKETVTIAPEEGYGAFREELILKINRDEFPKDVTPKVGQQLRLQKPDNPPFTVLIVEVNDDNIILDANHPLAGKTLIFDVELMEIL